VIGKNLKFAKSKNMATGKSKMLPGQLQRSLIWKIRTMLRITKLTMQKFSLQYKTLLNIYPVFNAFQGYLYIPIIFEFQD